MKLNQFDKSVCVQGCVNSYSKIKEKEIPEGHGAHGKVDWSLYEGAVNWWNEFNGEEYSCGYYGIINHPQYGKIGVVCLQGTTDTYSGIGWSSNFNINQVNQIKDFHGRKGGMVIPYGNEESRIRMHEGIIEVYRMARDIIRTFAKECIKKGIPIWIFGHSQGGGTCTAGYVDLHYMMDVEMKHPSDKIDYMLTGYAASSLAVFNLEGSQSFNKRANGNFYNEWYGNDTVHSVPLWWQGYFHVEQQKRYSDIRDNILAVPLTILTLGFFPSVAVWDHDPRKLLAAVKGEPIPLAKPDTTKDE
jgi:hypothetical protein